MQLRHLLRDPGVGQHLVSRDTLGDVDGEHLGHEVFGLSADPAPGVLVEGVVAGLDDVEEVFVPALAVEGGVPDQEDVEDHAEAPDVAWRPVLPRRQNLRCHVPEKLLNEIEV